MHDDEHDEPDTPLNWNTAEEHGIEVSPQARKVLEALREKPALLVEVSQHLIDGWPTEDLIDPWEVIRQRSGVFAFARFRHHAEEEARNHAEFHSIAAIQRMTGDGHEGDQWRGSATLHEGDEQSRGKVVRRVFNDPIAAGAWVDTQLDIDGKLVADELTTELVAKLVEAEETERKRIEDEERALEARRRQREQMDDDIPF